VTLCRTVNFINWYLACSSICFGRERRWKQKSSCFGSRSLFCAGGKSSRLPFMAADKWYWLGLPAALDKMAQTDPSGFVKAAVALMPRQIKMDAHLNDMTDEQLEASIRQKLKELDLIDPFIPKLIEH